MKRGEFLKRGLLGGALAGAAGLAAARLDPEGEPVTERNVTIYAPNAEGPIIEVAAPHTTLSHMNIHAHTGKVESAISIPQPQVIHSRGSIKFT